MKLLRLAVTWLRRLPARFSLLFGLLLLLYLAAASLLVGPDRIEGIADHLVGLAGAERLVAISPLLEIGTEGLVVLLLLLAGLLLAYNLAAVLYRRLRKRPAVRVLPPGEPDPGDGSRLDGSERIGIILAGGGAKGAYQAGALRAVHEFLEENRALGRVEMIAGTSIGAWNAMFWLADMVRAPEGGGASSHERWWRGISLERIVEFDTYWPLRQNHFLLPEPWRESFRGLFMEPDDVRERMARHFAGPEGRDPPVHFYFTRSNVELGQLEFATNWPGLRDATRRRLGSGGSGDSEPVVRPGRYEVVGEGDLDAALRRTRRAVFASMDLPPLFPYVPIREGRTEWFEDGGVVKNLPVRFGTQIENCDLLFVLPLNASFAEPVNRTSVTKRLSRVMNVRQGVMERDSLKMVYLYNELAELRRKLERADEADPESPLERTALRREHAPVSVFCIVPDAPLDVETAEFWKAEAAGEAFDLMHEATATELRENFERDTDPSWIRMTRVGPLGERTWFDDF